MSKRTDLGLRIFAALLILAGAGMLVGGITSTIPFAAIASGIALSVVLAQKRGEREAARGRRSR